MAPARPSAEAIDRLTVEIVDDGERDWAEIGESLDVEGTLVSARRSAAIWRQRGGEAPARYDVLIPISVAVAPMLERWNAVAAFQQTGDDREDANRGPRELVQKPQDEDETGAAGAPEETPSELEAAPGMMVVAVETWRAPGSGRGTVILMNGLTRNKWERAVARRLWRRGFDVVHVFRPHHRAPTAPSSEDGEPDDPSRGEPAGDEANAPYVWIGCPSGFGSWEVFDRMLEEANVVVTPGAGFGAAGEGYFRISAFNSRENVEEVCKRVSEIQW